MTDYRQYFLEKILPRLEKPTHYLGNEVNAISKDHGKCTQRVALAFPDLYEVGMSHLGLKILYHIINKEERWLAERVFMPGADLEDILLREKMPLCSLETTTPLGKFDLLGFTLQYELSYATVLQMLKLSGIPVDAAARGDADPLVVGGGPCAFNPEPLADFFDFFIIGDAEEALPEVLRMLERHPGLSRREKLQKIQAVRGVYVPSFYKEIRDEDCTYRETVPLLPSLPARVKRALVADLDKAPYPTDFIVPYGSIIHDRMVLELFRGCTRGCRFCQAGIIYRPVRERKKETLLALARKMVRSTGYEEMALSSLSSGDYSAIDELAAELGRELAKEGVSLSLPSLRLDSFSEEMTRDLQRVRKSGLTFAPEAGTQRLRDVINKNIREEDLLQAVGKAFAAGWTRVKLYFMIGLPTETDEDLAAIARLVRRVVAVYREAGNRGRPQATVSASVFVPKAHTPFQWVGQISRQEMLRRQELLRRALRIPGVQFQWHDADASILEAALARGGRELIPVIRQAADLGCKLDGWDEYFDIARWQRAFSENGFDLFACAEKQFRPEDPLPWDHLDAGVTKKYLLREFRRALKGETTPDCRKGCLGCGMALLLSDDAGKGVCTVADLD